MEEKIKANIILEMLGRPKEHLEDTIKKLVEVLGTEKGVKVLHENFHEATKVEEKDKEGNIKEIPEDKQLYTTFTEVEIEADDVIKLIYVVFKYMPGHIEVTHPDNFEINNFDLSSVLSEITAKLHNYDAIAKNALMQNRIIANKLKEVIEKTGYKEETKEPDNKKKKEN